MNVNQDDWLDRQLAASSYIADDGFTNRVVERVSKSHASAVSVRTRILGLSGMCAASLLSLHLAMLMPIILHYLASIPTGVHVGNPNALLTSPLFLYGSTGVMSLVSLAAIPLIRRWA